MNILCPQCQQTIAFADQYAGQLMKCPLCGGTFTAPALAPTATTAPAPRPTESTKPPHAEMQVSGLPESPRATATPSATVTATPPSGYQRTTTVYLSPQVISWIGPIALFLLFVLSFFNWLWVFDQPAKALLAQNAWSLAFAHPINSLSILYLLFLLAALLLAAAALVLPRTSRTLPPWVHQILPWRSGILLGIVTMGFVFLVLQLLTGFKQEVAGTEVLPIYAIRTNWLKICVLLHALALASFGLEFWLAVRKTKPLPRLDMHW
jgi:hypothetical protein